MTTPTTGRAAAGFATLHDETVHPDLSVTGTLPPWLDGTLYRNGPARFEAGHPAPGRRPYRHWFDGQAMLHRFTLANGAVSYANRYLDTPSNRTARDDGRIGFPEFATDPCQSIFGRVLTRYRRKPTWNQNVSVGRFGDRFVALGETPLPVEFDPHTLDTLGVVDYDDRVTGQLTTAHPHQDPRTGDLVNYVLRFGPRSEYRVYRQPPGSTRRRIIGAVPVDRPAYMHSFAITERYAVLVEYPLTVFPPALLTGSKPFIENYRWRPDRGTRFVVMDLTTGAVQTTCRTDAFFAFHHINAWDDGDALVLDISAYPDASVIDALYLDRVRAGNPVPQALPTRYRLDPAAGTVDVRQLADEPLELPRIHYARHNGRPYRHAYGVGSRDHHGGDFIDQLVKLDTTTGATAVWSEDGGYPGEPVFVPRPGAEAEDDGVLLSIVLDSGTATSSLLVLDARDLSELARARVPHAVPFGFHGMFSTSGRQGSGVTPAES